MAGHRTLKSIVPHRNLAQGLETPLVAFDGDRLLARGRAGDVALAVKRRLEAGPGTQVLAARGNREGGKGDR